MTFTFDKNSHDLLSKTFEVWKSDPEIKFDVVSSRFPTLKRREVPWTNPHIAPDDVYYEDEKTGVSVEVSKTRGEVAAITWYDPKSRSVAYAEEKSCVKMQDPSGLVTCAPSP